MFIGLFTVRIILKTLGEQDYGIYALVGGILAFLTFISGALNTGSQRFFSFEMGKGNTENLKKIFGVTFTIYLILASIIVVFGEIIGIWFINTHLNIPPERIFATNVIFQFVIISTAFTLIINPFSTAIMAHEDMGIFGKMAVLDAIFKISICLLLIISPWDKLITYGFLLLVTTLLVQSIYFSYAKKRYAECKITTHLDKAKAKEILSFSGWNLFGSLSWVVKTQGSAIVLNLFFGPVVNAAQGVANTVRTYSSTFSNGFSQSLSPQIVKNYAKGDHVTLSTLLHRGSKMTFYLMLLVVVPLVINMDMILQLWIGDHSDHMTAFCKLLLIEALIDSISMPLANANQATGKISLYQFLIGLFGMLSLPVAYIFLKNGYAPEWVFIISIIFQFFIVGVRILFLHRIYPGAVKGAFIHILIPCIFVAGVSFLICWALKIRATHILDTVGSSILYLVLCGICIWVIGLTKQEKAKIIEYIKNSIIRTK